MSGFARSIARAQARAEQRQALAAKRAIDYGNARTRAQHLAEIAALPDGWTSVELSGAIAPSPPKLPKSRFKEVKIKGQRVRRLGSSIAPRRSP